MQPRESMTTQMRILQTESRTEAALQITYTFYQLLTPAATYYAAEIRAAAQHDMQILGSLPHRAEKLFEMLVNEAVTPCTLQDVLHDMCTEEEQARHLENLCKN